MESFGNDNSLPNRHTNVLPSVDTNAIRRRSFSQVAASDEVSDFSEERSTKSRNYSKFHEQTLESQDNTSVQRICSASINKSLGSNNNITIKPWACDYCNVATFSTFHETFIHEQVCSMRDEGSSHKTYDPNRANILLFASAKDVEFLSDRQCYVRSNFVELFTATKVDVSVRHSRGAQRLHEGQIGIRCIYCVNVPQRERTERAVCYPSSISRIYQTVADMCRFHFKTCPAIPDIIQQEYSNTKTTRPRGVGSPQAYWIDSARDLGLIDSDKGIRYKLPPTMSALQEDSTRDPYLTAISSHNQQHESNLLPPRTSTTNITLHCHSNPGTVTDTSHATSPSLVASPPFSPSIVKVPTGAASGAAFCPPLSPTTPDGEITEASMLLLLRNQK